MNLGFQEWLNACNRAGVLTKKIILCNAKSEGHTIIEDFCKNAQEDRAIMNIEVLTPLELATKILLEDRKYLLENLEVLDREECAYLIKELVEANKLQCPKQFPDKASDATYQAVYDMISEIRLYQGELHQLSEEAQWKSFLTDLVEDEECGFYAAIKKQGRYDKVLLLEEAISYIQGKEGWHFKNSTHIVGIEGDRLSTLEKELISNVILEEMTYLKLAEDNAAKDNAAKDNAAKEDVAVEIWKNYGEENEFQRILKDIVDKKYSFDDVAVVCTNRQAIEMFHEVCSFYHIPVKFPDGFSIKRTNTIAVLYALYEWCTSMYDLAKLEQVVNNSNFSIYDVAGGEEGAKKNRKNKIYKQARRWGNGYGIQWYANYAKKLKEELNTEYLEEQNIAYVRAGYRFFEDVAKLFGKEGSIDMAAFYGELREFLLQYAKPHNSKKENIVFKCMQDKFYRKKQFYSSNSCSCDTIAQALKQAIAVAEGISVDFWANTEGITCYALQNLRILTQSKLYICGLNSQHFPGKTYESPFLSDKEKEQVYGAVAEQLLSTAKEKYKKDDLQSLIAYCSSKEQGRVVLSYSAYDVVEIYRKNPATIIREYAVKENINLEDVQCADYTQATLPNLRTELVKEGRLIEDTDAFYRVGADVTEGNAENKEASNYLGHDELLKDIMENKRYRFSATSLNVFLSCILQYYYRYVAGVSEENEVKIDPHTWLEELHNHKGNFAHYLMEDYVKSELVGKTSMDVGEFNEEVFHKLFEEQVKAFSASCPAPQEAIDREKEIYEERLKSYLIELHKQVKENKRQVLEAEYVFKGTILFQGYQFEADVRIDRIDYVKVGDEWKIQVVDYKTGDKSKHVAKCEDGNYPQHFYYEMAIMNDVELAQRLDKCTITEEDFYPAMYLFLYEEDSKVAYIPKEGDVSAYQTKREEVWKRVQELLDYVAKSGFWLSEEEDDVEQKSKGRAYKGILCKDCYAFSNQVCGHYASWIEEEKANGK